MKAWSDPTESKILLPRGYKHPQLSLSTNHQHPSSTGGGQETEYQGSLGPWTTASRVSQPVPGNEDSKHTSEIATASEEMRVIVNFQVYCVV